MKLILLPIWNRSLVNLIQLFYWLNLGNFRSLNLLHIIISLLCFLVYLAPQANPCTFHNFKDFVVFWILWPLRMMMCFIYSPALTTYLGRYPPLTKCFQKWSHPLKHCYEPVLDVFDLAKTKVAELGRMIRHFHISCTQTCHHLLYSSSRLICQLHCWRPANCSEIL